MNKKDKRYREDKFLDDTINYNKKRHEENIEDTFFADIMSRNEKRKYEKIILENQNNKEQINKEQINNDINVIDKKFDEEIEMEKKKEREKQNNTNYNTNTPIGLKIFSIICLLISTAYLIFTILFCKDQINNLFLIINASIVTAFTLFLTLNLTIKNIKLKNIFGVFTTLIISGFVVFNFLVVNNTINMPTEELLDNFQNKAISEALKWAKENNIEVEQIYEYSDNVKEYHIITQDIYPNTLLKDVSKITFTVSYGPNYDKIVAIPNMVGWNVDDALKLMNDNYLNNIGIEYELNEDVKKDTIFEQNISGQIRRNDNLKLTVSLGTEEDLEPVEMIDLKNKSLFEATFWLKRNGIKYEATFEFSDDIPKDYIASQNTEAGKTIMPREDNVKIVISKGKKIIVPDLTSMTVDEATDWIINNDLKVKFESKYDSSVELGKIIETDYKENDEIEAGTLITIITSKGPLKMPKFNNVAEFRNWANTNGINYREEYEFSDEVKKGEIIKMIPDTNAVINYSDTVIIHISYGKPVTVPSFIGKYKSEITKTCNEVGLNCTFYYNGNSDTPYDVAQNQNKNAGNKVVSGTYVNIGLSSGPKPEEKPNNNPEPKPQCDKNNTIYIGLQPGNDGNQTKSNISRAYPNIKWNFNMVDSCPNGSSVPGEVCNAREIDDKYLNYCDTYTVTIVK